MGLTAGETQARQRSPGRFNTSKEVRPLGTVSFGVQNCRRGTRQGSDESCLLTKVDEIIFQAASGFPQELQKRAPESFCTAPHDAQVRPTRRFAPQEEQ